MYCTLVIASCRKTWCQGSFRIGYSNSCTSDLELRALTKWIASQMLVRVSISTVLPPVPLWYCTCAWFSRDVLSAMASESARKVYLPVMCQAASVTHLDRLITKSRWCRKTLPQGSFYFLVRAKSFPRIGDSNSCPPDLELGALVKWLASQMLVWAYEPLLKAASIGSAGPEML